ncbi:MAG: hypothetical protein IJ548_08245 [Paludibacteraceae bacterium]|nr:hypothetical protein [Paludibacteraceae bacterium]MBQ8715078.1 hypothetical protein [Prevotella sp.]
MDHMSFIGVPFEGSSKEFFTKLKNKAKIYSTEKESECEVTCDLSFTGKWSHVRISGNPVYLVSVELHYGYGLTDPSVDEWKQMVNDYYDYKDALTQKYGSPVVSRQVTTYNGNLLDNRKNLSVDELSWGSGNPKCYSHYKMRFGEITIDTIVRDLILGYKYNGLLINYWDNYNKDHPFTPQDNRFNDL